MFKLRAVLLGLLVPLVCKSEVPVPIMSMQSPAECVFVSKEATRLCERLVRSKQFLDEVSPELIADKKGRAVEKEFYLIAWDAEDLPHRVRASMPLRPNGRTGFKVTTLTPGYTVERVFGTSLYKLEFRVRRGNDELVVYDGKHLWIPHTHKNESSYKVLREVAEKKQYIPSLDHLFHPEFAERGQRYLEGVAQNVHDELHDVPSRAYPGWTLRDTYPHEIVTSLVVSEHTDPFKLFDETRQMRLPRESYLYGTLVEIAIHGSEAFAELCSLASACGWAQFTNTPIPKRGYPGTYAHTYKNCRDSNGKPVLDADFRSGTRNPHNAIKAAFCYLDLENAALPHSARAEYLMDPKRGSVYMLAAYNGGARWSRKFFENVSALRKSFPGSDLLDHEHLPRALFTQGSFYNHETHWYIRKYLWVWKLLFKNREIVVRAMPLGLGHD